MTSSREMPTRWWSVGVALLLLASSAAARADPLFSSPPHFLPQREGHQVIFFLNEAVSGAVALRIADDRFDVLIPRSAVDPSIAGRDFGGDAGGGAVAGVTHLVVSRRPSGDTAIHIETAAPVRTAQPRAESDPPRLVVELLTGKRGPRPTPRPHDEATMARVEGPSPASTPGAATSRALLDVAAGASRPRTGSDVATSPTRPAPPSIAALVARERSVAAAVGAASAASMPTAAATDAPRRATRPTPTPVATLPKPRDVAVVTAVEGPEPAVTMVPNRSTHATPPAFAAAPAAPDPVAPARAGTMPCAWTRVNQLPFCAPDPGAEAWDGNAAASALALALGVPANPLPPVPTGTSPAERYLAADLAFVAGSASGLLLGATTAYREALRAAPEFADAPRARLNLALAYGALGFAAELRSVGVAAAHDAGRGLIYALAGDLALDDEAFARAREDYRRAEDAGGIGPCLAARGRAALAVETAVDPVPDARAVAERCPPEMLADPETRLTLARVAAATGDPVGARATMATLHDALPRARQARLRLASGAAAEAARETGAAREIYQDVARGQLGVMAADRATRRLALLDGAAGDVNAGLRRLDALAPGTGARERRLLAMQAVRHALAEDAPAAALALVAENGVDPAALPVEEQVVLAQTYRDLGLATDARRLLAPAREGAAEHASDALLAAYGATLLACGDGAAALAVADDWLRLRGAETAGALALRARALGALGEGAAALAAVERVAAHATPAEARDLRLAVGTQLAATDAAVAAQLLRAGLDGAGPEVDATAAAEAWRRLATAAEASGDTSTAIAAYTTVAERYASAPAASDAAYRAARLVARGGKPAYAEAARSGEPLARRLAAAAGAYAEIAGVLAPKPGQGGTP